MKLDLFLNKIVLSRRPSSLFILIVFTLLLYILALNVVSIYPQRGIASWYGKDLKGKKTASGEPFDPEKLTAAHKRLPFGTKVKVTNLNNDKSVVVIVTDRGPFVRGRIIDLSKGAAKEINMLRDGIAPVEIDLIDK
ncbi:MAG: septal ring lytic transglycosylase RlpA family protein [Candidatus Omnitrophica bacterium]|nr:septal ring lytic transglycosylase RlpA family protein [Candidatus Omnitrophota bacterium]MBD3268856.1 septal ring lytic transglycosylase RlpA family protein [Candidatus Omnitrophota bacterium]